MQDTLEMRQNNYNTIADILNVIYSATPPDMTPQIQAIQHGATDIDAAINSVGNLIGVTGTSTSDLYTKLGTPAQTDLVTTIGGTNGSSISNRLGDPGTGHSLIGNIRLGGAVLQTEINTINTILGGTGTTNARATTILNSILPSSHTNVTADINTVDAALLTTPTGNLQTDLTSARGQLVSSLGATNGSVFSLTNGGDSIVLYNRRGGTINTQNQAINYLASMYPIGSQISMAVSDKINNGISRLVGGSASSVRAKIAAVNASLLTMSTGVLATDLVITRSLLVNTPGATFQDDVQSINSLLNGTSSGSTSEARIGSPTVNDSASSVSGVIGGGGSDIASQLGDPVTGTTGLAALIKNNGAALGTVSGIDCSAFDNGGDYYSQLNEFLNIINAFSSNSTTQVQIPKGNYTCLLDLLAVMNHD